MAMRAICSFVRRILLMSSLLITCARALPSVRRTYKRPSLRTFGRGYGQEKVGNGRAVASNIQRIYDSLISLTDSSVSKTSSVDSSSLRACLDEMDSVKLEDLGIDLDYVENLKDCVCMNIVNSAEFDIQVFIIPKGKQLPLHDHPNMHVLSKVITGSLSVRCFSPHVAGARGSSSAGRADLILSAKRSSNDAAWMLSPADGNVHELKAEETTVVFDVLTPPYSEPYRPCNFYKSVESEKGWLLEDAPQPPNRLLPSTVTYRGLRPDLKKRAWGFQF